MANGLSGNQLGGAAIGGGLGGAVAGILDLAGVFGEGGIGEFEEAVDVFRQLQDPNFDFRKLSPAQLRVVAQIDPVFFDAVVPEEVKVAAGSPVRGEQLETLSQLQDIGREGLPLADRLAAQQATEAVAGESGRAQQAILQNLAARGRVGGGQELQARLAGELGQGQLRAQLGRGLAQAGLDRRLQGLQAAGQLGGQVRGQDENLALQNAQMQNRFNEFVSGLRTRAAQAGAEQQSLANLFNAGQQQRVADFNAVEAARQRERDLGRFNQLQQQLFNSRFNRAQGLSGALGNLGLRKDQEKAGKVQAVRGIGSGLGSAAGLGIGGLI